MDKQFDRGDKVNTTNGPGVVLEKRLHYTDFNHATYYSVRIDAFCHENNYISTRFTSKEVSQMPDNRINNNSETVISMDLEALVRVYCFLATSDQGRPAIEKLIKTKLVGLDEMRSYKFDTEAAAKQLLEEINSEHKS